MNTTRAYVSGGHVYCKARQTDVDISECLDCGKMRELHDEASPPYLLCEADAPISLFGEDPAFLEWWFRHRRRAR